MGSRGQPAAQDTRCRETFPAVSHGKGASPPWAPSWPTEPAGTSCSQGLQAQLWRRSLEGDLARPNLQAFLPLTTRAPACSGSLPPPRHHPRRVETSGTSGCSQAVTPDVHSWVLAGPRSPGGRQAGRRSLPATEGAGRARRAGGSRQRGQGGSVGGRGLPSHASPQAGSALAARDEFVYSQETRLPASREKGFFTGA